jgi:hypothetical protein
VASTTTKMLIPDIIVHESSKNNRDTTKNNKDGKASGKEENGKINNRPSHGNDRQSVEKDATLKKRKEKENKGITRKRNKVSGEQNLLDEGDLDIAMDDVDVGGYGNKRDRRVRVLQVYKHS